LRASSDEDKKNMSEKTELILLLAGLGQLNFCDEKPEQTIGMVGKGFEVFMHISESIDLSQLKMRFEKEALKEEAFINKVAAKLKGNFAKNAPEEIVRNEKEKMEASSTRLKTLRSYIEAL
ncbi:MAG TPA: valine--tRNA ligase, partial [Treponemataceae bacterium]|nr:valine--tRNA ligase [Treponemataceae bacterium]